MPEHAEILHLSGFIAFQTGRLDIAAALMRRAVLANPREAAYFSNLGIVFLARGQPDDAIGCYRQALRLDPHLADAHNNLGNALRAQGKVEEAAACFRQALAIRPDYPDALNNMGNILQAQGKIEDAVAAYRRAIAIKPDYADAYANLGNLFHAQGRPEEALPCLHEAVRLAPRNGIAQHLVAALTGTTTERAPAQYVERLFDEYAAAFDTHLQQRLKYDVPARLAALIAEQAPVPAEKWTVLDLGCGTGLVGVALAPFARRMTGVDLSSGMLKKARERNVYHRLEHLDLLEMMQHEPASGYDVIVAADVFIYVGKLDELVREARRLLNRNGILAFSVETPDEQADGRTEYRLDRTGRYVHSSDYLSRLASAAGFEIQAMAQAQLRLEQGKPVNGYLVIWRLAPH